MPSPHLDALLHLMRTGSGPAYALTLPLPFWRMGGVLLALCVAEGGALTMLYYLWATGEGWPVLIALTLLGAQIGAALGFGIALLVSGARKVGTYRWGDEYEHLLDRDTNETPTREAQPNEDGTDESAACLEDESRADTLAREEEGITGRAKRRIEAYRSRLGRYRCTAKLPSSVVHSAFVLGVNGFIGGGYVFLMFLMGLPTSGFHVIVYAAMLLTFTAFGMHYAQIVLIHERRV